jgi:hypothetical protein
VRRVDQLHVLGGTDGADRRSGPGGDHVDAGSGDRGLVLPLPALAIDGEAATVALGAARGEVGELAVAVASGHGDDPGGLFVALRSFPWALADLMNEQHAVPA